MSFGFTAAGTAEQVKAQLDAIAVNNDLGLTVKSFLEREVLATPPTSLSPDHEAGFLVEASGHNDPHSLSLTISVRQLWLPLAKDVAVPKVEG
jgi:hypothetical protein